MIGDYLTRAEVSTLGALEAGSIPATSIPADVTGSLAALGLVETTWADRIRLTNTGRELFQVVAS